MELGKFMVIWLSVIVFASMFAGGVLTWLCLLGETGERALGDINGDGEVNVIDSLKLLAIRILGKTVEEEPSADVDGNGVINVIDSLRLLVIRTLAA